MIVPRLSGRTEADRDRHARLALEPAETARIVAARGEQQLQVGARQPLAAAAEHHRGGDAKGQRAAAGRGIAADLAHQPRAARQLVDRDLVLDPMADASREMVGEVGADPRQVVHDRNADRLQVPAGPIPETCKQVRRVDRAAAEDHLARRGDVVDPAAAAKGDAGAAPAVETETGGNGLGDHPQIAACRASARKVCAVDPRNRPPRVICE